MKNKKKHLHQHSQHENLDKNTKLKSLTIKRNADRFNNNEDDILSSRKKPRIIHQNDKISRDNITPFPLIYKNQIKQEFITPKPSNLLIKNEMLLSNADTTNLRQLGGWIPGLTQSKSVIIHNNRQFGRRKIIEEPLNPLQFLFYMQCIEISYTLILEKLNSASIHRNKKAKKLLHLATKDVLRLQNDVYKMKLEVKHNKRKNTLNFIDKTLEHNFLEYSIFKEKLDNYLKLCSNAFENTLQLVPLVNGAIIGTDNNSRKSNIESFLKHMNIAFHSLNDISAVLHLNKYHQNSRYFCDMIDTSDSICKLKLILEEELNMMNVINELVLKLRLKKLELDSIDIQEIQYKQCKM